MTEPNVQLQNELHYYLSVQMLKRMLGLGLITETEYRKIDLLNRQSFSPELGRIMA